MKCLTNLSCVLLICTSQLFSSETSGNNGSGLCSADSLASKLNKIGLHFIEKENYTEALAYLSKAEFNAKNPLLLANILNNQGLAYANMEDNQKALNTYINSLTIFDQVKDSTGMIMVYNRLGNLYRKSLNKEKSLEYYNKSLKLCTYLNDYKNLGIVLHNIGLLYIDSHSTNEDKALKYLMKSYYYSKKAGDSTRISVTIQSIGQIYMQKKLYIDAIRYIKTALKLDEKNNYQLGIASSYCNLANIYLKINKIDLAKEHLDKSYLIASKIKSHELIRIIYNLDVLYYGLKGNPEVMWEFANKADSVRELLYNIEGKSLMAEMQTKYETEKKENTIKLLQAQYDLRESQLRTRNFTLIFLILIIIFMGIGLIQKRNLVYAKRNLVQKNLEIVRNELVITRNYKFNVTDEAPKVIKYSSSNLDDLHKEYIKNEISRIFNNTQLYLENSFGLGELSEIIGTNKSYVSQVINEFYSRNFNSLLNEFRIREARKIISDPTNHKYTLESIAHKVGYNSKTSFNTAFKKYTGLTPSFYIESLINERKI